MAAISPPRAHSVPPLLARPAPPRPARRSYAKALSYAQAHMGAVHLRDAAAIDDLFSSLRGLEWERVNEETGEAGTARLHEYQIVALSNLNPGSVAAARSLIPSLIVFSDDEVGEMLSALRRSSAKYSGLDAAGGGEGGQ